MPRCLENLLDYDSLLCYEEIISVNALLEYGGEEDGEPEYTYTDAEYDSYEEMMSTPLRDEYKRQRDMSVDEYLDYLEYVRQEDESCSMYSDDYYDY